MGLLQGQDLGCHLPDGAGADVISYDRDASLQNPSAPRPSFHSLQTFLSALDVAVHAKQLVVQALLAGPDQSALHHHRDAAALAGDLIPNSSQPLWETHREAGQCPNKPAKVPCVC